MTLNQRLSLGIAPYAMTWWFAVTGVPRLNGNMCAVKG